LTGHPGEVPVRSNLSLGDSLAAFQAVIGALLALLARERIPPGRGQVVDVSIVESVLQVMEAAITEFDRAGVVRGPSGTTITGVVPTDAYPCADGRWVVIGANGDSIFRRLMLEAGRRDLADDPRLASNDGRVRHREEVDEVIRAWTASLPSREVVERLVAAAVPVGPIRDIAEIAADPHLEARGAFARVDLGGRPVRLPTLGPLLSGTPGRTDRPGGDPGADTESVLRDWLGLSPSAIADLRRARAI
jgi:crotonobetainyl-CoA:carnitine CoA-transferase CaiB-like acyl-CoA transferase